VEERRRLALRSRAEVPQFGGQGLTLTHFLAQHKRFLWDKGCMLGLFRGSLGGLYGVFRESLGGVLGGFRGL